MITRADTTPAPSARPARTRAPASAEEALERARSGVIDGWREWDPEVLAPVVRVALLGAETARDPRALRGADRGEPLYQAVRGIEAGEADRLPELVTALAGTDAPVLEGEALRLARAGLHALVLTPRFVRGVLTGLLTSRAETVVAGALDELAAPWAACLPAVELAAGLLRTPATAGPALAVAAAHGHGAFLGLAAADPELPPGVRRRALELLGETADRSDIPDLLALAADDPLLFAGPAVDCLRALHRRGHFVAGPGAPAVIGLALADHTVPARTVATILWTTRHTVLRLLLNAAPGDLSWPRRLDLLVALAAQGDGELPVAAGIARLLPAASAPAPFLRALRELGDPGTEDAVLAVLPLAPGAALHALEAVGGARTVRVLAHGLGIAPDETDASAPPAAGSGGAALHPEPPPVPTVVPPLRALRAPALALLWLLADDPDLRRRILVRLDPLLLPPGIAADLGGPDARELAVLASHLDPGDPLDALTRLAAHGGPDGLPVLADLLLRVAGACVAARAAGQEPPGTGASGRPGTREPGAAGPGGSGAAGTPQPVSAGTRTSLAAGAGARDAARTADPEPAVPQEAVDALTALGRRLYERGRIRPRCLLDAPGATAAGHALAADLALGLVERPGVTAPEQAILLRMVRDLPDAPPGRVRARVHRLLRHPDRHVRKHVVALLARDPDGVAALSARLIRLTGPAGDPQTVRATAAALGEARARWASDALADCLTHPHMEVRKTAAGALARAGTPRAVPALLNRLGRDDNPGLRTLLVAALRALLDDAFPATVRAAAEREPEGPVRDRLLAALPTAPEPPDADVARLADHGWDPAPALRLARRATAGPEDRRRQLGERLRPLRVYLVDWLDLAAGSAEARRAVLPLLPLLCPEPRAPHEQAALARGVPVLLDGLAEAAGQARDDLLGLLEDAAPRLRPALAASVVAAVRAAGPRAAGRRSALRLLRACGAVVGRADLDRELAAAGLTTEPDAARERLLHEAFGVAAGQPEQAQHPERSDQPTQPAQIHDRTRPAHRDGRTPQGTADPSRTAPRAAQARAWRDGLAAAVRDTGDLAAYRAGHPFPGGSRAQLAALAGVHADATLAARTALTDWMTDLQPPCAPAWTLGESAAAPAAPARAVRADDLDQPRSAAQRARLLALLASDDRERRSRAAGHLVGGPEPEIRATVLDAYLRDSVDLPDPGALHTALAAAGPAVHTADGARPERLALLAAGLVAADADARGPFLPLLLRLWETGPPDARRHAARGLANVSADTLAEHLEPQVTAGATGLLDLLAGRPLLRTPALARLRERHPHARLLLVDGPLRGPEAAARDAAALRTLRDRAAPAEALRPPTTEELFALARSGEPRRVRRALTLLTEDPAGIVPRRLADLLRELLTHPRAGVRLHAHRVSRTLLDRETHLGLTEVLLDDPQPDVVCRAVRVLAQARRQSAVPALVALLGHGHETVRRAAELGLLRFGPAAVPALRHAAARARPDRRVRYTDLLARVPSAPPEPGPPAHS
ncbi:HEAT repeat domain-containing protein [Streptomyces zhihengii]